jgi:FdhE protein
MTGWSFEARIARADELAKAHPAARELLIFYRDLASLQKVVFDGLRSSDRTDLDSLPHHFPALLRLVRQSGPKLLADFGSEQLETKDARETLLAKCWEGDAPNEPARFYGRVLLQPYAEHLASRGSITFEASSSTCPFCSARPVASVLRGEGEGGKRSLLCSLCSTEWPFRRVVCPNCGQEDKQNLPVYSAPDFSGVRVEACDRCKTYIKSVDLTKDGRAVPTVDELATVALNVWAEEHGYTKLEPNLLGM